jgi:transposase
MEATGVYWMPVYVALEGCLHLVVGNPQHMRNLRGHKTDRKDARWIAGLVRHGLIRPSFVPPPEFREARELARFRRQLVHARSTIRNEVLRLLARQGITLAGVLSNVFGASGTAILNALAEGRAVIDLLPTLIHRSVKGKVVALTAALEAPLGGIPRELLVIQLQRLEEVEQAIGRVEGLITRQMEPFSSQIEAMVKVPGISWTSACIILAEIGVDMSIWPTEKHLAAWGGVAPGSRESGGKRMNARTRKGNVHLTTILVECAGAAVKKKGCHLGAKFQRLRARIGYKKALMAIARKLLLIVRKILAEGVDYQEPKPTTIPERIRKRTIQKRVKELQTLGFDVYLTPLTIKH